MQVPLSQYRKQIERVLGIAHFKKHLEERRHRRFLQLFNLPNEGSVLDISCGDGDFLSTIHSYFAKLELYGIDMSTKVIEKARTKCPNAEFVVAYAELIPHKEATFDVAISCMSLHHYAKPREVFSEVARILSAQGKFYLIDFMPMTRLTQVLHNWDGCPEPYHFEKYYLRREVEEMASGVGLILESDEHLSRFDGQRLLTFRKENKDF
jgi:ubiquinone/menaquinone biosynthesis C-methylase UbiE